ncbi:MULTISPECIES: phosphoenolpyruvate hydrolase family protein [Roseomonadaceae]|uniref:Phosphoenolpyruvate hydrolase family protein n=1 Tax=Falsiroseomonas oleicola TaxID=2801474 RepID=A0ABS6H427_9PROT|nr:phosphoenolpyruvate hydrolase family protein [Roseomonas oleicola]MBU8543421.1 phosphoenolpyruvate hydrolase family protein [Roseomonas oleicola]
MTSLPGAGRLELVVGAAMGLGMTARAAADGGADFLLALSAGRLRVMGAPSLAAMLPIRDSNAFTDEFARQEILDRVSVPVFFGAAACDPRLPIEDLLRRIQEAGYHGVANFPTAIHYDGTFRTALEAAGLGFGREVAMLRAARDMGLATLGYAKTRAEVDALLGGGVERLCLNFGWNSGGSQGVPSGVPLDQAAERARRIFRHVRRTAPRTLCFVEGGPIIDPAHLLEVCDASRADGYVGGSTLDRLPLEMSVMQTTSAFKTAGLLRDNATPEAAKLPGLVARSRAARQLAARIARLVATDLPILVEGEPGAGRTTIARAIHQASGRAGGLTFLDAQQAIAERLFGEAGPAALLAQRHSTVVIESADALPPMLRARLADWIERGSFERFAKPGERAPRARLVLIHPPGGEALARALSAQRLLVPPLRDRMEDLPLLARAMLRATQRPTTQLDPTALRLLMAQPWPGNLRQLAEVLTRAATEAPGGRLTLEALEAQLGPAIAPTPTSPADERAWILEALRRNRFRRGETAAFLGIARKTLYNRMRRLGLEA